MVKFHLPPMKMKKVKHIFYCCNRHLAKQHKLNKYYIMKLYIDFSGPGINLLILMSSDFRLTL